MDSWGFGDVRLSARADRIVEAVVATGSLVLRRLGETRAGEVAAHRFLDNDRVSPEAIIDSLSQATLQAAKGRRVLVIQDTTEVNFAGRDASRVGLGQAGGDKSVGFFIHPLIAVDIESAAVLGVVDAEIWTRPEGPAPKAKKRPFAEKDSARWLRGCQSAADSLEAAAQTVVVADRESDIYTVFAQRPDRADLVIRACFNRRLASGGHQFDVDRLDDLGEAQVVVAAMPGRKARTAAVSLRAGRCTLPKPEDNIETDDPPSLDLNTVEVIERQPPRGASPLHWRLVTTLPVTTGDDVRHVVDLYRLRWRIEEVFRVLKTDGLDLEATQVEAADRLFKLAALGLVAATRIVQLVDARDASPRPASDILDPDLHDAADLIGRTLEGTTERQKNPHSKGSLPWLSWIVARLGGWNCYYKPPGPKTMAIGWKQFTARLIGYMLAQQTPSRDV